MQQLVKQIIKNEIDPLFKENGFIKKRNNFARIFPEFAWTVNIQFSKWNTREESSFTFNIGIFINKLCRINYNSPINFPTETVSTLKCRICLITNPDGIPYWYTLNKDTSVGELKKQIRSDIEAMFSHFERFQEIEDIIIEMENNRGKKCGLYFAPHDLTVLYHQFGNIEKAQKRITELYSTTDNWNFKLYTMQLAEKLGFHVSTFFK
jgi:hypothetical protein